MAFQQSAAPRAIIPNTNQSQDSSNHTQLRPTVEDSQEWVLFSPSQAESTITRTQTSQTVGLSRASDISLNTAGRSGRGESLVLDEDVTEDGDLDSLDEGLHAFRENPLFSTVTNQTPGAVLPTHDGLGTFPASSPPVLEQLWQHEAYNPKRKHDGQHRRPSSVQRRLDTIDEIELQAREEKRIRIEKWRLEQSQALMEEVERETRRRLRRGSRQPSYQETSAFLNEDVLGSTPKQSDYVSRSAEEADEYEPFWRRITRKFIRDVIGIDEPLLSVIFGESLPEDVEDRPSTSGGLPTIPEQGLEDAHLADDESWRDRLLQRIARELGVFVHQLSPHPGAFTTYSRSPDYAGMPVSLPQPRHSAPVASSAGNENIKETSTSLLTPNFPPTLRDTTHAESWGFEEDPVPATSPPDSAIDLRREREYWERELDLKMVFRYLKDKFVTRAPAQTTEFSEQVPEDAATRAAIIRQHHPLVARAQRSPVRVRRESRTTMRRPASSCASESVRSSRKASLARSGSSRNYWDIGGSVGSGSIMASGGAWGEV
ncbi:hypothetical protein HRR83_009424 [Exophiala dermatitidis]|uniref:Uncharacterized protein n=1 Tax=Exophiala dermatitidis TaxID=5970 RepID=A0AAN6ELE3_EXODE|nr:hypothetical protein HRR73_009511 [Exophiala dermatitidis]KAJ4502772.1 hypothetical protein HRR74_009529 [Exophiala dermatitidis]KAJ4530360.1 hypothetical protein HRR77_009510 [Exophiala dermatitidis]KAJ4534253.1 hypothetical protein HRR76_006184 [Exophiala dermatitidis]KAJ4553252.1 hypothetical protein HRR79_009710 [Exophiala dermatitidis]